MYRVTRQISNTVLSILIWEFQHIAQMPCQPDISGRFADAYAELVRHQNYQFKVYKLL